jgi:toxin-antitoxin system PIN domain toxin
MKLPDVNLLLYAHDRSSPYHEKARQWLEKQLSGSETFAFAWVSLLGFIRLSTNPRVFARPLAVDDALAAVDEWLAQPCAVVIHPGSRHTALLREMLLPFGTAGNLTTDAHLAALAIEHGAELHSADPDFARFSGLRWTNPLAA